MTAGGIAPGTAGMIAADMNAMGMIVTDDAVTTAVAMASIAVGQVAILVRLLLRTNTAVGRADIAAPGKFLISD